MGANDMNFFLKKHKWFIGFLLYILVLLCGVIYLYCAKGSDYLFSLKWHIGLLPAMLIVFFIVFYLYRKKLF